MNGVSSDGDGNSWRKQHKDDRGRERQTEISADRDVGRQRCRQAYFMFGPAHSQINMMYDELWMMNLMKGLRMSRPTIDVGARM